MDKKKYQEQEKKHVLAMKKAGVPKSIVKQEMKEAGMKSGAVKKMAFGGPTGARAMTPDEAGSLRRGMGRPRIPELPPGLVAALSSGMGMTGRTPPTTMPIRPPMPAMKKGGKVAMPKAEDMGKLGMMCGGKVKGKGYAKGGGIEAKGKTKGKMV